MIGFLRREEQVNVDRLMLRGMGFEAHFDIREYEVNVWILASVKSSLYGSIRSNAKVVGHA
jgi:hypothetical protein